VEQYENLAMRNMAMAQIASAGIVKGIHWKKENFKHFKWQQLPVDKD